MQHKKQQVYFEQANSVLKETSCRSDIQLNQRYTTKRTATRHPDVSVSTVGVIFIKVIGLLFCGLLVNERKNKLIIAMSRSSTVAAETRGTFKKIDHGLVGEKRNFVMP